MVQCPAPELADPGASVVAPSEPALLEPSLPVPVVLVPVVLVPGPGPPDPLSVVDDVDDVPSGDGRSTAADGVCAVVDVEASARSLPALNVCTGLLGVISRTSLPEPPAGSTDAEDGRVADAFPPLAVPADSETEGGTLGAPEPGDPRPAPKATKAETSATMPTADSTDRRPSRTDGRMS